MRLIITMLAVLAVIAVGCSQPSDTAPASTPAAAEPAPAPAAAEPAPAPVEPAPAATDAAAAPAPVSDAGLGSLDEFQVNTGGSSASKRK